MTYARGAGTDQTPSAFSSQCGLDEKGLPEPSSTSTFGKGVAVNTGRQAGHAPAEHYLPLGGQKRKRQYQDDELERLYCLDSRDQAIGEHNPAQDDNVPARLHFQVEEWAPTSRAEVRARSDFPARSFRNKASAAIHGQHQGKANDTTKVPTSGSSDPTSLPSAKPFAKSKMLLDRPIVAHLTVSPAASIELWKGNCAEDRLTEVSSRFCWEAGSASNNSDFDVASDPRWLYEQASSTQ